MTTKLRIEMLQNEIKSEIRVVQNDTPLNGKFVNGCKNLMKLAIDNMHIHTHTHTHSSICSTYYYNSKWDSNRSN